MFPPSRVEKVQASPRTAATTSVWPCQVAANGWLPPRHGVKVRDGRLAGGVFKVAASTVGCHNIATTVVWYVVNPAEQSLEKVLRHQQELIRSLPMSWFLGKTPDSQLPRSVGVPRSVGTVDLRARFSGRHQAHYRREVSACQEVLAKQEPSDCVSEVSRHDEEGAHQTTSCCFSKGKCQTEASTGTREQVAILTRCTVPTVATATADNQLSLDLWTV